MRTEADIASDVARDGIEPSTFRFSGGRSYQLSYLARRHAAVATLTGLEPATSAVTGRRANQLRHRALLLHLPPRYRRAGTPYGIRTRATALKGRRPRPLDEGGQSRISPGYSQRHDAGSLDSLGYRDPNAQTRCRRVGSILSSIGKHTAPIAQLVELRTFNPQVPGSSPGGGTTTVGSVAPTSPEAPNRVAASAP
jgi:hypothetical protein